MNQLAFVENINEKYFHDRGPDLRKMDELERRSRTWKVNEIWEMHHEVIRLLLIGMKNVDIAKKIGITEVQVSNIKNSPVVQDRLSLMKAARDVKAVDISRDILEVAPKALELLKKVINGETIIDDKRPSVNAMIRTSESLLDRAGFGAVKKVATQNEHVYYTAEEIEALKARARKGGEVVDAEDAEVVSDTIM